MITSFFDGRVRIRAHALRNPEKMALVENTIKAQDGVFSTVANLRTGSLLVEYDPQVISREMLDMAAQALQAQLEEPAPAKKAKGCPVSLTKLLDSKLEMGLLTAAFGCTLFGGMLNKRMHIGAGLLFYLLTAKHMYSRRKRLM